jgi:ABC-2 type transport system ATP-binding protein
VTAPTALVFDRVSKDLAGRRVLDSVSFACPPGTITALLGPNGAGKTTAVSVATGLRRADAGAVRAFGIDVRRPAARAHTSLVPQDIGFPDAVTAGRCLDFVARQRIDQGLSAGRDELCERLGLTSLLDRRAGGFSGGQRRKLAVALGLIHAPGVLIMDEATTNLDETARAATWDLVRDYARLGGTAVVTSHILADIESHSDRVIALGAGRVVLDGPLAQLRAQLGGSLVSIQVAPLARAAVRDAVARAGPASVLTAQYPGLAADTLIWRTRQPFALLRAIAAVTDEIADVEVRPIPLRDLLDAVVAPPDPTASRAPEPIRADRNEVRR